MNAEERSDNQRISTGKLLRLRIERERRGWTQNQLAKGVGTTQANISRWENGALPGPYYRRKLAELFGITIEELGFVPQAQEEKDRQLSAPAAPPHPLQQPFWNVPYRRNPFFTGREAILASLALALDASKSAVLTQAQAISGLGGIGKTQIAVEYAYSARARYQAILWATASTRDSLLTDFISLATVLDLPEQYVQDQDIIVRAVKRWLNEQSDWLLILDNVDDPQAIMDFLPDQAAGNILLTTRLQAIGSLAQSIEVEKMSLEEATTFLLRRSKILKSEPPVEQTEQEQWELARKVADTLDGLPLALDQAGAYIEETRCDFSGYLSLYQDHRKDLLERRGALSMDHPASVAATWSLSFQQIERDSPAAAHLLQLFTFLNPEAIPEEIIAAAANEPALTPDLPLRDPFEINAAIEVLLKYSLLSRSPEARLLSLHRLVQAVLKDSMDASLQRLWAERAIRAVNQIFPEVEFTNWAQCQRCLPHVLNNARYAEEYGFAFPEAALLFYKAATYLEQHAQYEQAEKLLKHSLSIWQKILPPAHPDIARILNDLGALYLTRGRYTDARPLLEQALAIRRQALGQEHPTTALSLNKLAELFFAQGEYQEAEELYQHALQIQQQTLEPDHLDTAQTLNNLATLYEIQGKNVQAAQYYIQAFDSQVKILGRDHLDVARTMSKLALLSRRQGEYAHAEKLYEKVLKIQEQALGSEHPIVAETLNEQARLCRARGEYSKANELLLRALEIRQKKLGRNHPDVAQSLYALGSNYNSQGRYRKAAEACEQALSIQEQQLDSSHLMVASTLVMLAKIYLALHRLSEATDYNRRALHIRLSASGPNHPQIAFIKNNQAEICQAQGKYDEAFSLVSEALSIYEQSYGPDHPYIAYSRSILAVNYFLKGEYTQAEESFQQALAIRERLLGVYHPHTASSHADLAKLCFALERYQESESHYSTALTIQNTSLDPEHPAIATTLEGYALLLHVLKKESLASGYEARAAVIRMKQSGS